MQALRAFLILLLYPFWGQAATFEALVVSIHDGDTVTVQLAEGSKSKVRLLGTDSPEVDFNGRSQGLAAERARDYLMSLLPIGERIRIVTSDTVTDKHDRLLGTIFLGEKDINYEMLRSGWSAFYLIAPYDKTLARHYSEASKEALTEHQGIFSKEFSQTLMMPYLFRTRGMGKPGNNLIGHLESRILFNPEAIEQVPPYARVFFPSEEMALSRGFRWAN